jgi:hypothetical protein
MSYPELWKLRDAHFEPDHEDSMAQFKLAFDQSLIPKLAARYSYQEDVDALQAGKGISKGRCTRANLKIIFEWKTNGRGRSRLTKNTDKEISDALKLVTTAKTDRAAIAVLTGLNGVQVPVASAILTAIDPKRFTIIDFRALQALNQKNVLVNINYYLEYLIYCRKLARDSKVTLRTLDQALWQWSKEQSKRD